MNDTPHYSASQRRAYIQSKLHLYRPDDKKGYSLRDIALDIARHFNLQRPDGTIRPVSATTIKKDLAWLEETDPSEREITLDAQELLKPENFPQWRAEHFVAPMTNEPYETPEHQLAWFHLFASLVLKEAPPDWVVKYFDIEDMDLGSWAKLQDRLITLFILAPPRHGKSDLFGHACIWAICRNPNVRIIWCGGTLPISELTTSFVKNELELNEKLIANYGPFQSKSDWSNNAFTVATRSLRMRAPTMVAIGKGSGVLSRDADIIIMDDYVDLRASESPTQVGKDVRWAKSQLFTRREPWTPVLGIGSHQPSPTGDAYTEMAVDKNSNVHFIEMKAHDYTRCKPAVDGEDPALRHGEWCILWNSLRPWWYLESMRDDLGDLLYEVCYNQDISKGKINYFREKVLRAEYQTPVYDTELRRFRDPDLTRVGPGVLDYNRSWGQVPACCGDRGNVVLTLGFDPAAGETRGSSESALSVRGGCRRCGRRYLIATWADRVSPETHPDTILRFTAEHVPQRVRVEANAYQKALAKDKRLVDAQSDYGFILDDPHFTGDNKRDPLLGIPVLSRQMEAGKLSIPYQLPQDRIIAEDLIRQYLRWPQEPNDRIMADWLAELSLAALMEELSYAVPSFFGSRGDVPEHLLEQTITIDMSLVGE